jgi:hypothetical protein
MFAITSNWRGPQRGFAARPAYARTGLGAPSPKPALRGFEMTSGFAARPAGAEVGLVKSRVGIAS